MPTGRFRLPKPPRRYSGSSVPIGGGEGTTDNVEIPGVPKRGRILQIRLSLDGLGTRASVTLRESVSGRNLVSYPMMDINDGSNNIDVATGAIYYEIATGENMIAVVATNGDDESTTVDIEVTAEGV